MAAPTAGQNGTGREDSAHQPARSCESLAFLVLPNTSVESAKEVEVAGGTPSYCDVQLTVNDGPSGEPFRVGVFLPTSTWNGRFVGTGGGGGWAAGNPSTPCGIAGQLKSEPCALDSGYATANTDAGVTTDLASDGGFVANPDHSLNWQVAANWSYRAIHGMTVTAKNVVAGYYGQGPVYSYFNGGSAGGRQAMMEAQRYPTDYDGLSIYWPAMNWSRFIPAELWPQVVMNLADHFIPQSTFDKVTARVVAACDELDGVKDDLIADWKGCHYDARRLVGDVLTAEEAEIVNKIWEGPRGSNGEFLHYGLLPGTEFRGLAGTVTSADGTTTPRPFWISVGWFRHWLAQNPEFDWRTMTYDQYVKYFAQSVSEFDQFLGANDPDLSAFRQAGGKLVITHGTGDEYIPVQGTVDYYDRLTEEMGGPAKTQQFARLFLAPGGGHGTNILWHPRPGLMPAGYRSSIPTSGGMLEAVVNWVEHSKAPKQLLGIGEMLGGETGMTRPLCVYPLVARYKGQGSTDDARNFVCGKKF